MTATDTSKNDKGKRPVTFDHLKSKKQPSIRRVKITMSSDAAEALDEAEREVQLQEFKLLQDPEDQEAIGALSAAKEAHKAAQAAADEDAVEFVFRSLGRKPYDALVDAHPPTKEQTSKVVEMGGSETDLQWNADTFPVALVSASLVSPKFTPEEVQEMWDSPDWAFQELQALFFTALAANQARRVVDSGNV